MGVGRSEELTVNAPQKGGETVFCGYLPALQPLCEALDVLIWILRRAFACVRTAVSTCRPEPEH